MRDEEFLKALDLSGQLIELAAALADPFDPGFQQGRTADPGLLVAVGGGDDRALQGQQPLVDLGEPDLDVAQALAHLPEVGDASQPAHGAALRDLSRSALVINPAAVGDRQRAAGPSQ